MVIYGRPNYSVGKDFPAMGPFRNLRPNIVGPGSGKIKFGILVAGRIAKYILSRPWAKGTLTGTAIGTGIGLDGFQEENASTDSIAKAYSTTRSGSNRYRRNLKRGNRHGNRCTCKHCCN